MKVHFVILLLLSLVIGACNTFSPLNIALNADEYVKIAIGLPKLLSGTPEPVPERIRDYSRDWHENRVRLCGQAVDRLSGKWHKHYAYDAEVRKAKEEGLTEEECVKLMS